MNCSVSEMANKAKEICCFPWRLHWFSLCVFNSLDVEKRKFRVETVEGSFWGKGVFSRGMTDS